MNEKGAMRVSNVDTLWGMKGRSTKTLVMSVFRLLTVLFYTNKYIVKTDVRLAAVDLMPFTASMRAGVSLVSVASIPFHLFSIIFIFVVFNWLRM